MQHKGRTGLAARGTRGSGLIYSQSPTSFPFSKSLQARCSEWGREQKHQPPPSGSGFRGRPSLRVSGTSPAFHKVLFLQPFWGASGEWERKGTQDSLWNQPSHNQPGAGLLRCSLSASSRQLRCIAYSCSRVSGSEAVKRRSSSDFIHSWYLQGQRGSLQQAGPIQKPKS